MAKGRNEEEVLDKVLKDMALDDESDRKYKENLDELYRRNGLEVLPNKAPDVPDNPPCDGCGENWTGIHACAVCQSAFYCSKECQRVAWKSGHKKECKELKATAKITAEEVVGAMEDADLPCYERVAKLEDLSCAGFYKAALARGINSAIQALMKEEKQHVLARYQMGECVSYVNWVMCVLFRGGRREGHGMAKGAYSHVDGYRCKSYVLSSPDAFEDWFQASMELVTVFVNRDICRIEQLRVAAMRTARDVIATWSLVFANKRVSKAIVLGQSKNPDEAAVQRAKWIANQIKPVLTKLWNAAKGVDTGGSIEGHVNQVGALILLRLKEHKVPVDFFKLMGLKGTHKAMFNKIALPFADHVIRKGRAVDNEEGRIIMQGGRVEYKK